jgi:hypothetical protein
MRITPQPTLLGLRLGFEPCQGCIVAGVLPVPPRHAGPHQFAVQALAIGIRGDRPHHDVLQLRATGQLGDFPGHSGKRGGEDVFLGGRQAHDQDMPPGARQLPHDGGTEDTFTQEFAEPLKQHLRRGRFGLAVKDHCTGVALDVAPRVEDPFPEGHTVLAQVDVMGCQVLARGGVGELKASDLLIGIGVDGECVVRHA